MSDYGDDKFENDNDQVDSNEKTHLLNINCEPFMVAMYCSTQLSVN